MTEANPSIKPTVEKINASMGGDFEVVFIEEWRRFLRAPPNRSTIVHLTMYGEHICDMQERLRLEENILIVIGAGKVPREVYEMADYNVAVGNQPHSEISALAVFLDRIQDGCQLDIDFPGAQRRIVPAKRGKNVVTVNEQRLPTVQPGKRLITDDN